MRYVMITALLMFACNQDRGQTSEKKTPEQSLNSATEEVVTQKSAPTAKQVKATKLGDPRYVIQFPSSESETSGTFIKILPLADYKMNLDYPAALNLDKSSMSKQITNHRQAPSSLTEAALEFKIPVKADKEIQMKGLVDFSVCNAQACEMIEKEINWTIKPDA